MIGEAEAKAVMEAHRGAWRAYRLRDGAIEWETHGGVVETASSIEELKEKIRK